MNSQFHGEDFEKIQKGLKLAQVSEAHLKQLQEIFDGIPAPVASKIIKGGTFSYQGLFLSQSGEAKERRDLARGMNYVLGLQAHLNKQNYAMNKIWHERMLSSKIAIDAKKSSLRSAVNDVISQSTMRDDVAPASAKQSNAQITPQHRPAIHLPAPICKEVDPPHLLKNKFKAAVRKIESMNMAAKAFSAEGAERSNRAVDFIKKDTKVDIAWMTACNKVSRYVTDNQVWFQFNYTSMNSAIKDAYQHFEVNVTENQAAISARLDMAKQLFSALKTGPFPVSMIGDIGCKALDFATVDTAIDSRGDIAVREVKSSGFISKVVQKLTETQEEIRRVGPKLLSLSTQSSLGDNLSQVCQCQLRIMQEVLKSVCDEHFGDTTSVMEKISRFKTEVLQDTNLFDAAKEKEARAQGVAFKTSPHQIMGRIGDNGDGQGSAHINNYVVRRIQQYQDELIEQIKTTLKNSPEPVDQGFMCRAVEMKLYCSYITLLFAEPRDYKIKPLSQGIVDFFAQEGPFGILIKTDKESETHAKDNYLLAYKDDANHKKVLRYFCEWYAKNINPFMLVAGSLHNGEKYSPYLIMLLCKREIGRINEAVYAGRSKGTFGMTNWDWQKINLALNTIEKSDTSAR